MDAGFDYEKIGIKYYCFHDIDLISEGSSIEDEANLKAIVAYANKTSEQVSLDVGYC